MVRVHVVFISALFLIGANADSIKSCGKPTDILQNAVFTSSPNPIDKSQPLTITATGKLSAAVTTGKLDVNLNIKALGIINEPIKTSAPFALSPGLPAGDAKIVIGPFSLPKVPGKSDISGTVTVSDGSGKEILCISLDIVALPTADAVLADEARISTSVNADPVTDCSGASDHLHNRVLSNAGGKASITGDLDEALGSITAIVDLTVEVSIIKIPIKMTIPISISPPLPKGHTSASIGPAASTAASSTIRYSIEGTVKVDDSSSSEVVCLNVNKPKLDHVGSLIDVQ